MEEPKFKIIFEDGETIEGLTRGTAWRNAPDKKVKSLFFDFAGIKFVLENYTQYNHLLENQAIVGGGHKITKLIIMGRKPESTDIFCFDMKKRQFHRYVTEHGKEYNDMILTGWKDGLVTGKAVFHYVK